MITTESTEAMLSAMTLPPFTASQYFEWLAQDLTFLDELSRRCGIELEHLIVAWYNHFRPNVPGQLSRFVPKQIARHPTLDCAAINREQCDVDVKGPQFFGHLFVSDRVAAVVDAPTAELENIAEILRAPLLVAI